MTDTFPQFWARLQLKNPKLVDSETLTLTVDELRRLLRRAWDSGAAARPRGFDDILGGMFGAGGRK